MCVCVTHRPGGPGVCVCSCVLCVGRVACAMCACDACVSYACVRVCVRTWASYALTPTSAATHSNTGMPSTLSS